MKAGWEARSFVECIEKVAYTQKIQRKYFLDDGAFPVVSQEADFINGYWDNKADLYKVTSPIVIFGDHTKVLKYVDFDFVLGADGVKILQPQEFLLPKFFFYQLLAADLDSLGYARHFKLLKELEITYPDIQEQQRIVRILDEAFDAIAIAKAHAEKNMQNAREVFASYLDTVFKRRGEGYAEKHLMDVCVLQRGFDLPTRSRVPGKFPIVSSSGVIDSHNDGPVKGPGVVTGRSGSIGNVFYIEKDFWPLNTVLYVKQFYNNNPKFVFRLLSHFDLQRFATGSGVPTLNRNFVHNELVIIPESTSIQRKIADQLDELEQETRRLEIFSRRKLAALDDLKKSMLNQAFDGEL
jgi:type I restriction enzyme, S subunit